jgi:hypothetical protein
MTMPVVSEVSSAPPTASSGAPPTMPSAATAPAPSPGIQSAGPGLGDTIAMPAMDFNALAPPVAPPAQAAAPPPQQPAGARTMLGFAAPPELQRLMNAPPAQAPAQPAPPLQSAIQPAPQPMPMHAPGPAGAKTMLGVAAPEVLAALQHAAPPPAAAPPAAYAPAPGPAGAKTMLGVAMPGIAPIPAAAPPPQAQAPMASGARTMLGVAVPGIAPTHAGAPQQPPQPIASQLHRTMLGVAAPGIAPLMPGAAPPPDEPLPAIVPAPRAPIFEEPLPSAPQLPRKRGMPIAVVAGVGLFVVLLVGGVIAFLWRGGAPIVATPHLGTAGNEQLHLKCTTCPDETTATLGAAKATFKGGEADIDVPTPLVVGDNAFEIAIDRPAMGRDEHVKLKVPVSYRIRADLSEVGAATPSIGVLVEATPGSQVTLDGKPVTLDASGKATARFELGSDAEGFADETKTIERKYAYTVVSGSSKDKNPGSGDVVAKVGVLPLHLDSPGPAFATEAGTLTVAGRTAKGAAVTVNGAAVTVAADGSFEGSIDVPNGETSFAIRTSLTGGTNPAAARSATFKVRRVTSVEAEEATLSKAVRLGYDAFAGDVASNIGQAIAIDGTVLEARTTHHQTLLVIDDHQGCAKGPCLLRVVYGADFVAHSGDAVHAYGKIARAFATKDGKVVPEVDAEILLKGRGR